MDQVMQRRLDNLRNAMKLNDLPDAKSPLSKQLLENISYGFYGDDFPEIRRILTQVFIVTYREAKLKNPDAAKLFLRAFDTDYTNYPGSRLFEKLIAVLEANYVLKQHKDNKDPFAIFQALKESYRSGSEFIASLIGWIYPMWQIYRGENPDFSSLKWVSAINSSAFTRLQMATMEFSISYFEYRIRI